MFFCVGAGIRTLMSIFDGLDPYIFLLEDGKDTVFENRNEPKVFISRQSRHFFCKLYD